MKRWLIIIASVMAGAAIYAWFLDNFEKQPDREYVGYQGEARFNDFLAAELLLLKLDIESESRRKLRPSTWLPAESDTLVTRLGPELATDTESTLLVNWVRLGGHLLLLPPLDETRDVVTFMEEIGVRFFVPEEDDKQEPDDVVEDSTIYNYSLALDYVYERIELLDETDSHVLLSDDKGVLAARQRLGNGFITIYASAFWFTSRAIEQQDHARLFLDSVAGFVEPGKVWLFYAADFTPLWRLIWDAGKYMVLGLLLAFIVWLWSRMPRFGPLLGLRSGERRSIVEHVSASGRFIWQNDASSALTEASVAAVLGKAERRHPGIGRLPRDKQALAIGNLTDEDPRDILQALMTDADDRPREFAQHIKLLQKIRNRL